MVIRVPVIAFDLQVFAPLHTTKNLWRFGWILYSDLFVYEIRTTNKIKSTIIRPVIFVSP